jgi:hypothetical protein
MRQKRKRTPGMEEAHSFTGMSRVHPNAAGVDIGATEIVACVSGDENTQILKAFGNYTVDLQALAQWMKSFHVKTVAMESTGLLLLDGRKGQMHTLHCFLILLRLPAPGLPVLVVGLSCCDPFPLCNTPRLRASSQSL